MNHYLDHCTGKATSESCYGGLYSETCGRKGHCLRHAAFLALEHDELHDESKDVHFTDAEACMDNGCINYLMAR